MVPPRWATKMAKNKFPVTSRTDVLPEKLPAFKAKYGQEKFDKAMNAPNSPRPAKDDRYETPADSQGWIDRSEESYNVTSDYCEED